VNLLSPQKWGLWINKKKLHLIYQESHTIFVRKHKNFNENKKQKTH